MSRDLLTVDLEGILDEWVRDERNDGFLHPSEHLAAPLRHAQLSAAGAPKRKRPFDEQIVLKIGQMIHEGFHDELRRLGIPYMAEVNLGPWMPPGWNGTADAVIWNPELKAFVLADFKTSKGESIQYRVRGGASDDHVYQTSIYWHSLRKMGIPLAKAIGVLYIPKNKPRSGNVQPLLVDFDPIPVRKLTAMMNERKAEVDRYKASLPKPNPRPLLPEEFVTDELAPEPDMEQRVYRDKASGDQVLKLVPKWQTKFCDWEAPLCSCSEQRSITIGRYDEETGAYTPRVGYEDIEPLVAPE
jgi:hypothetical protein